MYFVNTIETSWILVHRVIAHSLCFRMDSVPFGFHGLHYFPKQSLGPVLVQYRELCLAIDYPAIANNYQHNCANAICTFLFLSLH